MKKFLCLLFIGLVRANPVVEPQEAIVPVVVPKEPVVGIVDSVVVPEPVVPLINSPKIEQAVVPEIKNIDPVVIQDQKIVPVSPVIAESVVPAAVPVPAAIEEPVVPVVPVVKEVVYEEVKVEKNSQDPGVILSEPIDKATKLVIDLDEHLRKYLPADDEVPTTATPVVYAPGEIVGEDEQPTIVRQNQMTALIDQVNRLAESIENTITDLVARRRYVTAAMLRSMLNYVRRVRVNLERLQNRLQSVQAVATSGQNAPQGGLPAGVPGTAFFNTIRDRINRITEEIGSLVTRIRASFTPGVVISTSPLPPLATAAAIAPEIAQASASASIVSAVGTIVASGTGVQSQAAVVAA